MTGVLIALVVLLAFVAIASTAVLIHDSLARRYGPALERWWKQ